MPFDWKEAGRDLKTAGKQLLSAALPPPSPPPPSQLATATGSPPPAPPSIFAGIESGIGDAMSASLQQAAQPLLDQAQSKVDDELNKVELNLAYAGAAAVAGYLFLPTDPWIGAVGAAAAVLALSSLGYL
jgi:hypothetical protein